MAAGRESPLEPSGLLTLVALVLRRRRMIVAIAAAALATALLYVLLAEQHFTATATLIPDVKRSPPSPSEVAQDSLIDPAVVENQIEIMKSERIALAVVDKRDLQKDPEFVGKGPGLLGFALNLIAPSGTPRASLPDTKRRKAAAAFSRKLKVARVGRSYLAEISVSSVDPLKAAVLANETAEAYIQDQLGAKFANADRSARWMRERIAELERESVAAAKAVEAYRANGGVRPDAHGARDPLREQAELAPLLERAQADTARAQARADRIQSTLHVENQNAVPDFESLDAEDNPELVRLRAAYREALAQTKVPAEQQGQARDDPELSAKLEAMRREVWRAVRALAEQATTDLESARLRQAALMRRSTELASHSADAQSVEDLEARLRSTRQLHESLQNRFARVNQFTQEQSLPVTEARVISEAAPPLRPSSPKSLLILMLALSAGFTAGIGTAFVAEHFDRRVRRAEQISDVLGLRPLGALQRFKQNGAPSARRRSRRMAEGQSDKDVRSPFVQQVVRWLAGRAGETLRAVKLMIDMAARPGGARVVSVVSPNAGEGKTTVALALAMLIARGGKRVLLIDGDLRNASLTTVLTPGATDDFATSIHRYPIANARPVQHELGFAFLGQAPGFDAAHPSDIFAADALQDMLDEFRKHYDYVLFDTAALLAHIDVAAIAGLFDAFVMVSEFDRTRLEDIDRAVRSAGAIGDRLVGVLINKAPKPGT